MYFSVNYPKTLENPRT